MVGPFVFFDHIGPVDFPPGIPRTVDVRPHPHIGLVHGHLPVRRRDHASRQPRLRAGDPSRRGQLDDGRPRHHAFGALRARAPRGRRDARHPGVGRAAARARGDATRRSCITRAPTCRRSRPAACGRASSRAKRFGAKAAVQDALAAVLCALAARRGRAGADARRALSRARRLRRGGHRRGRRPRLRRGQDARLRARRQPSRSRRRPTRS